MTLEEAIEIVKVAGGYRTYPGAGGMWTSHNIGLPDAQFDDRGLAKATAIILNAVISGGLKP